MLRVSFDAQLCFLLGAQAISGSLVPPLFWSLGVGVRDAELSLLACPGPPAGADNNAWEGSSPETAQAFPAGWASS